MAGWTLPVPLGFDVSCANDGKGEAVVAGAFPVLKRPEVGAEAEDCGADVVEALSCVFPREKRLLAAAVVVGVGADEDVPGWVPRKKPLDAFPGDDTVGAEDAGKVGLAKLKADAVVVGCEAGALEADAAEEFVFWPPNWKGLALLSAVVSGGLFRLLKSPPVGCAPPWLPKIPLPPLAVSKTLGAAEVVVEVVLGLFEGCGLLLKRDGVEDEDVAGFPNRLLFWLWGLLKEKGFAEGPTLMAGGGPAGVVELPNRDVAGLLVGVVVD